VTNPKFHS